MDITGRRRPNCETPFQQAYCFLAATLWADLCPGLSVLDVQVFFLNTFVFTSAFTDLDYKWYINCVDNIYMCSSCHLCILCIKIYKNYNVLPMIQTAKCITCIEAIFILKEQSLLNPSQPLQNGKLQVIQSSPAKFWSFLLNRHTAAGLWSIYFHSICKYRPKIGI